MSKTYGVIDLGSNTFHLLIVTKLPNGEIIEIDRERNFVGLGDGGIDTLKQSSINKGLEALKVFKSLLFEHNCSDFKIIGTAALRTASNAEDFINPAEELMQKSIIIIDGLLEADYIFKGINLITDMSKGLSIIMDIGGGSTEFIVVEDGKKIWSKSYKLGVGVLHADWHKSEPIGEEARKNLLLFLINTLVDLTDFLKSKNIQPKLVGASGSFEVLESMSGLVVSTHENQIVSISRCREIIEEVVRVDFETRRQINGLPYERTKLIVVGLILIEAALDLFKPSYVEVCPYALKEGVLADMMGMLTDQIN